MKARVALLLSLLLQAGCANDRALEDQTHTITITPKPTTLMAVVPGSSFTLSEIQDLDSSTSTITVTSPPKASGPICGGANQEKCGKKPAEFVSKALGTCPRGSFFDIGLWQCWTCPHGYKRSLHAVDTDQACVKSNKNVQGDFGPATYQGPVCPKGSFFDHIRGGECFECPSGYYMDVFAHVDTRLKCFKKAYWEHKRVNKHSKAKGFFGTDCPKGQFWDLVDGHCYSCPSGYGRTQYHVHSWNACSKHVGVRHKHAILLKKAKCNTGEIRDDWYNRDGGKGGTCWTCPTAWERTVFPVYGGSACEKAPRVDFARATKTADLTCPAGQIFDFTGLNRHDYSTRKELKGKKVQLVQSGTCWSCPTGYDRTWSSVKANDACESNAMAWYSRPFTEPGLFRLIGAEEVLLDIVTRHPSLIKDAIDAVVKKASESNENVCYETNDHRLGCHKRSRADFRKQEIKTFTTAPHHSTAAAAAVFARVLLAIAEPKKASAAEKRLVASFKNYIIARRSHVAKDALKAYDAWKAADTYWRSKRNFNLVSLIDYGTVPPDYSIVALTNMLSIGSASTAIGIATGSIPLLGDALGVLLGAAGNGFADFSHANSAVKFGAQTTTEIALGKAVEFAIKKLVKSAEASIAKKVAQKFAATATERTIKLLTKKATKPLLSAWGGAGPMLIIATALMIGSMALDQFAEINNARPKLLAAVAHAKYDPGLERLVTTEDGTTELFGYWSYLIAGDTKPSFEFTKAFAQYAEPAATGKVKTKKRRLSGHA